MTSPAPPPHSLRRSDHPNTNFHTTFDEIRSYGFFLELLGSTFDCFDAENYGRAAAPAPDARAPTRLSFVAACGVLSSSAS